MSATESERPMLHDRAAHPRAFPRLSDEQMRRLEPLASCEGFEDGQLLFDAGEQDVGFFVIRSGAVRIVKREREGRETLITVHGPGDFTGELQMVNRQPSVVAAVAHGPVRAMRLKAEDLRKVLAEESEVGEIILRALLERRALLEESHVANVRLIGSRWSPRTFELKDFLARNRVLYRWDDPDADVETETLLQRLGVTPEQTPVVMCDTGGLMHNPTIDKLADCLGLRTEFDEQVYDVAIVGGGPAGLAAAVYAASEGLTTVVLDTVAPGGQAGTSSKIENYLGFPTGISGAELAGRAATQARKFNATISSPSRARALECSPGVKTITLANGDGGDRAGRAQQVQAKSVILATGAQYRKLDAANRERFEQSGIYYGATHTEASPCLGEDVVVIGGGNSAGQAAVFLSGFAKNVQLLIRGPSLAASMSRYLIDRIDRADNIQLRTNCRVSAFEGGEHVEAVVVRCRDGSEYELKARGVFVMIGADPNTGWIDGCVALDSRGFILTGAEAARHEQFAADWDQPGRQPFLLETTRPGVFAVGDVRSGSVKRVASAVGEGAMAVKFVHEVLA